MQHHFHERRSILVQDIRELTSMIFPKLVEVYNHMLHKGQVSITVTELFYWMLCELTEKQYAYAIRQHNSKDPAFRIPYDYVRNVWAREQFSLERLFEFYVKGPAMYVPSHDVEVGLAQNGADIVFTFYWSESEFLKVKKVLSH